MKTMKMNIVQDISTADIVKALLDKAITSYLDNNVAHSDGVLEKNIIFWARALKWSVKDNSTRRNIADALHQWKDGKPLTLQEAEDALRLRLTPWGNWWIGSTSPH